MHDQQRNKLKMYMLVKEFLLASEAITDNWAAFAALFASFTDYITEIFAVAAQQEEDNTGVTKTKALIKTALIAKMLEISEKCRAYASVKDDMEYLGLIKFMKGELQNAADAMLITKANTLQTHVAPRRDELAVYKLEDSEMSELLALKNQFEAIYTLPESNKKKVAKLTARLNTLYKMADTALIKIDALLLLSRVQLPDFYEAYRRKRIIGKRPTRTRALQLWVVDDATGLPVAKAKVTVRHKAGTNLVKVVRSTGPKGGMIVASMDAAEYEYEVIYGGYLTSTGSFFVNDGVMTDVVVRLKK